MLLTATAIAAGGYVLAGFVIPRLPLPFGFEGFIALSGAVGIISFVIASVLAARAAISVSVALRHERSTRTVGGYVTLVLSGVISLGATIIVAVAILQR